MRITPLDVRKQEFRRGMRGLDPDEVYAFLATVADEYEAVLNDNKALRERLLELDDKVQEYRTLEKTLRDTLLTAERVNAEAKDNARREANIIIKEAQIEAEKALRDIKTEAMKLRSQVQQLRSQRDGYLARMKVVAESHLSYIDSAVTDFREEDAAIEDLDLADEPASDPSETDASPASPSPNLFETTEKAPARPPAEPAPPPRAPAPRPVNEPVRSTPPEVPRGANDNDISSSIDPISVIIDRMKRGQQEILSSGAGSLGLESDSEGEVERRSVAVAEPEPKSQPSDDTVELKREAVSAPRDGDERQG